MIEIWTDGACSGNPGIGGWAAIIICGSEAESISGAVPHTTNNRMELLAAIKALEASTGATKIFTDSDYVKKGITLWIKKWQANGWRTASRKPVKNEDLWRALLALTKGRKLEWHWVKAHAGIKNNEKVDELARSAIEKLKRVKTETQNRF